MIGSYTQDDSKDCGYACGSAVIVKGLVHQKLSCHVVSNP